MIVWISVHSGCMERENAYERESKAKLSRGNCVEGRACLRHRLAKTKATKTSHAKVIFHHFYSTRHNLVCFSGLNWVEILRQKRSG